MVIEKMRAQLPDLVRELESIDLALQSLGSESQQPAVFTAYKNAIDAVVAYLEQIMRTEDKEVIAQAIVDGGWLKGSPHALKNARASLKYHVDRSAEIKTLKRFPSGRIGLYAWSRDYDHK
jgi:Asp/Glu/hydantoin racemase